MRDAAEATGALRQAPDARVVFQHARNAANIANRTINMNIGVLKRVLEFTGHWSRIKDGVSMLAERKGNIGRALTREETQRLLQTAASNPAWAHAYGAAVVAANTSLRPVEVKHLKRRDIDLFKKEITVNRAKGESGLYRRIPLNREAVKAFAIMLDRADAFGFTDPSKSRVK